MAAKAQQHMGFRAGRLDHHHTRRQTAVGQFQMLGADAPDHPAALVQTRHHWRGQGHTLGLDPRPRSIAARRAGDQVHRGRADEARHKDIGGAVVKLQRCPDLGDMAVAHHHDAVGHGHRLDLVVGDIDRGGAQALMQLADLAAHLHPKLGVKVRERLVEQEHLGIAHNRAPHRDALALAPRQLARVAPKVGGKAQNIGRPRHPRGDLGLVHPRHLQRKAHVRGHRLVRIKRVVLEHHRDIALGRGEVVHHPITDRDLARGDAFQPRDHPQQGGFAAARRPDQHHELTVGNIHVHAVNHLKPTIGLAQIADADLGHCSPTLLAAVAAPDGIGSAAPSRCPPPEHTNMLDA